MKKEAEGRVDVLYNDKLLTAYRWDDSIHKPFLFPVNTVDGIAVTRGWPLEPRGGERTDHPHHVGSWLNYESVNGLDFWNNSTAIVPARRHLYGTIRHRAVTSTVAGGDSANLLITADWLTPTGDTLLTEQTRFLFAVDGKEFWIRRYTTLTGRKQPVVFKDVKDGFFAIRVARQLEHPSTQADFFTDVHGHVTKVKQMSNEGVSGRYVSSEGKLGDSVWGTRARWVMLEGAREGKDISLTIFDHPKNPGYPSYWHARGYGLFAVNPLGQKIFSNGKEELNLTVQPGQAVSFAYGLLVASGKKLTAKEAEAKARLFAEK